MNTITLIEQELDNEGLIINEAKKDSNAFEPLYTKYYKVIFRFIYNKVLDKDVTADITSNVFVKAMGHLHSYEYRSLPFSSWLYKIAYNEIMQYYRKEKKERKVVISEEMLYRISDESDESDFDILKTKLKSVLNKLDLNEIQLIELRFYENLTFSQISQILGITENNAKVRAHRIIEKIRQNFQNKSK